MNSIFFSWKNFLIFFSVIDFLWNVNQSIGRKIICQSVTFKGIYGLGTPSGPALLHLNYHHLKFKQCVIELVIKSRNENNWCSCFTLPTALIIFIGSPLSRSDGKYIIFIIGSLVSDSFTVKEIFWTPFFSCATSQEWASFDWIYISFYW